MKIADLAKIVRKMARDYNKKLFTSRELATIANESMAAVGMALLRGKKNGLVDRVQGLWVNMIDRPTLEEVALELKSSSYISFESALYKHGILSQSPRGFLTVATTSRSVKILSSLGNIQFIHLLPELFFGFDKKRLALPEKAFLDMIYIKTRRGTLKSGEVIYTDVLNRKRLYKLAKTFPKYVEKTTHEILDTKY